MTAAPLSRVGDLTFHSMVQSIELLFDERTEAAIRASWVALADAGLPSLADHRGASNRPHVTVAVLEAGGLDADIDAVRVVFAGWALTRAGFAAVVGAPLLFGGSTGRWVVARQIVPSRPLLTLHSAVHRALGDVGVVLHTRPDRWTPHVTLASRMPGERLGDALAVLPAGTLPCRFVGARLWDSATRTVTPLT